MREKQSLNEFIAPIETAEVLETTDGILAEASAKKATFLTLTEYLKRRSKAKQDKKDLRLAKRQLKAQQAKSKGKKDLVIADSEKLQKYQPTQVSMSDITKELGDPGTWDKEDAEYEQSLRHQHSDSCNHGK